MGMYKIYTEEQLIPIILRIKRDNQGYKQIAGEFKITYNSVAAIAKVLKKYWNNEPVRDLAFTRNYVTAVKKVKTIMGLPAPEPTIKKGKQSQQEETGSPSTAGSLTVIDIIKIIYLRKKITPPKSFKQIAEMLGRNEVTVWACLNAIENRYWNVDPLKLSAMTPRYLHAMFAAKAILISDIDPFTADLTEILATAKAQVDEIVATRNEIPTEDAPAEELIPQGELDSPPFVSPETPPDDLFRAFEQEIIGTITTFITKIVQQKQTVVVLENKKLAQENGQLKKRNEELTRKLLSQKQSSLADSLKNSFSTMR